MALVNTSQAAREYQRTQVETARPTQLIVMLYDGAIRFLSAAREKMLSGEIEARHTNLLKAQRIITELISSLKQEQGGQVADNLLRLYVYMLQQLVEANINDTTKPIDVVIEMLRELRASWAEVDRIERMQTVAPPE